MSSLRSVAGIAVMAPIPPHALLQWGEYYCSPCPPQYPTGLRSEAQRTAVAGTPWCIVSGGALVLWGDGPLAMRIPAVAFVAKSTSYGHRIQTFRIGRTWFAPGNQTKSEPNTKSKPKMFVVLQKSLEPKNCGMAAVRLLKVPVRITQGPSTNTPCSAAGPSVFCLVTKRRQTWRCSWATCDELWSSLQG